MIIVITFKLVNKLIQKGYANEIGEAFRSMISIQMVKASYGVAFGNNLIDYYKALKKLCNHPIVI